MSLMFQTKSQNGRDIKNNKLKMIIKMCLLVSCDGSFISVLPLTHLSMHEFSLHKNIQFRPYPTCSTVWI